MSIEVVMRSTPEAKIQALQALADNIPHFNHPVSYGYSLGNTQLRDGTFQYEGRVELPGMPITDHHPAVAQQPSATGLITVSLNVCAPFSPIGKNIRPQETKVLIGNQEHLLADMRRFDLLPADHQTQMEMMAQYVFELLKAGADLIPLQEVPDPTKDSKNYNFFVTKLNQLVEAHRQSTNPPSITFNADHFKQSLQWTMNTRSYTGVIANESRVKSVSKPISQLNGRAAQYVIETVDGKNETLVNMHADYSYQQNTLNFITLHFRQGHIIAGDPNLTMAKLQLPGESTLLYHHDLACCPIGKNTLQFDHNQSNTTQRPLTFPTNCVCEPDLYRYIQPRTGFFAVKQSQDKLSAANKLIDLITNGRPQDFTRKELDAILEKHRFSHGDSILRKTFIATFSADKITVLETKQNEIGNSNTVRITPAELGIVTPIVTTTLRSE